MILSKVKHSPLVLRVGFALVTLLLILAKYGVGIFPALPATLDLAIYWEDPHRSPYLNFPGDYIMWSPGISGIGNFLEFTSIGKFLFLSFVFSFLALVVPFLFVTKDPSNYATLSAILVASPVMYVLFGWVGGYDSLTVIGLTIGVLAKWKPLSLFGWILASFNNQSQAVFSLSLLIIYVAISRQKVTHVINFAIIPTLGVAIGTALIYGRISAWGGATTRIEYQQAMLSNGNEFLLANYPYILWSVYGVLWVAIYSLYRKGHKRESLAFVAIGLICVLLIPTVALDVTRVSAIVLLPAILWSVSNSEVWGETLESRAMRLAILFAPILILWNGQTLFVTAGFNSTRNFIETVLTFWN